MALAMAFPAKAADDFSLDDAPAPKPSPVAYTDHFEVGAGYQSLSSYYFARYGGVPPYRETKAYVHKVLEAWKDRS